MKGKTIGCFCRPHPCHGDVIAEWLDAPVRLAVVGSRTFNDYARMCEVLERFEIIEVISGGARGADALVERYARERGLPIREFAADLDTHGKSAGFLRNRDIVAAADEVVAFWDGRSRGTQHAIELARTSAKPVYIHWQAR